MADVFGNLASLASQLASEQDDIDFIEGHTPPTPRSVLFNGLAPPGKSWPTGAGSPRKYDEQAGYGTSGALLVYHGNGLSEFDVVVQIGWEKSHWREWNNFAQAVLTKTPSGKGRPNAIEITHPMLNKAPLHITKVVILDVTQFEQVSAGLFECRIKCKDGQMPKPALAVANDGIPPLGRDSMADAARAVESEGEAKIRLLARQANELQQKLANR